MSDDSVSRGEGQEWRARWRDPSWKDPAVRRQLITVSCRVYQDLEIVALMEFQLGHHEPH